MGYQVNGDDGPGGFPPHYCKTDCRDDGVEGRCRGMGVGLGGRGAGGDRYLADEGVRAEASGKNCGVLYREEIYEMYTGEEMMKASSRFLRWWHQEHVPTQVEREVG